MKVGSIPDAEGREQDDSNDDDSDGSELSRLQLVAELVADLFESVFDSKWEVRHGALLSLRQIFLSSELVRAFEDVGRAGPASAWLEECLVRCICVLALDQFVDYSADGSVSPVREVCAQVLGILLGNLRSEETLLLEYLEILRTLFRGATWHACHGAMLGLKYLVLAHKTHAQALMPIIFEDVLEAFEKRQDEEEVLVLAGEILGDFTPHLGSVRDELIWKAAMLMWQALAEHTTSGLVPACTIRALSAWYNHGSLRRILERNERLAALTEASLCHVVPLLHQPLRAVRLSAAECAAVMFQDGRVLTEPQLTRYFLSHLLLQLLREEDDEVQASVVEAWKKAVLSCSKQDALVPAVGKDLSTWVQFLWSTAGVQCLDVEFERTRGMPRTADSAEVSSASRVVFADAIGYLGAHVPVDSPTYGELTRELNDCLHSASGERQCGALLTISRWAFFEKMGTLDASDAELDRLASLQRALGPALEALARQDWVATSREHPDEVFYTEQQGLLKRVRVMESRILEIFISNGVSCSSLTTSASLSAAECSRRIAENVGSLPYDRLTADPASFELAHFKRQDLYLVDETLQQSFSQYYHRVQGLGSCAFCNLLAIPSKKSGFLVKALMDSLKLEENADFQRLSAQSVAAFAVSQAAVQRKCVAKILSNLCNSATALAFSEEVDDESRRSSDTSGDSDVTPLSEVVREARVRVFGAENALRAICEAAGARVFLLFPSLDAVISKCWASSPPDDTVVQHCCHLVCTLAPVVHADAFTTYLNWLQGLASLVTQCFRLDSTREAVARASAVICLHAGAHRETAMALLYHDVFAVFSNGNTQVAPNSLLGAAMVLHHLVVMLSGELVPYIPSLVHYAMKAMGSQTPKTRSRAALAFADLVPLIPLQMDLATNSPHQLRPHGQLSESLETIVGENQVSRTFLENLLAGKAVKRIAVDRVLADGVSLRTYQHHGVDWLSFLFENSLHGILADDMGLGKTLQTLAAIAASTSCRVDSVASAPRCLIVCPAVVVDHWLTEATSRLSGVFESVVDYSGSSSERKKTRGLLSSTSVSPPGASFIVTTYSVLRSDVDFLKQTEYAFVVLDEAHLVRNPATSLFSAVRQLVATHRVALSGTPLQNNVADLWSLFEFLMPGYLGEFAAFRKEFVLPISKSRERNATPKQKEVAALAITRLHQRVLPFILRRTKSQVLKELPPKIISNVLVTMTPVQKKLYALACRGGDRTRAVAAGVDEPPLASVLGSLHTLRKICVHPVLVAHDAVTQQLNVNELKAASDWSSSGKVVALRDLLVETCEIGVKQPAGDSAAAMASEAAAGQHRCLIFGHLKETLDVIERMFTEALPSVTYRRLDGHTAQHRRAGIVKQFNDDPSIDVLLLTTSVGGLGLTLTGADTVIFMEHSWNPFVDLQAMDRAHRIGQRSTVRVFRLIVKESVEEHIMDLQGFKERVATTVVAENDARRSMSANTTEVLSLLQSSSALVKAKDAAATAKAQRRAHEEPAPFLPAEAHELLNQLGELWDESQYASLAFPDSSN